MDDKGGKMEELVKISLMLVVVLATVIIVAIVRIIYNYFYSNRGKKEVDGKKEECGEKSDCSVPYNHLEVLETTELERPEILDEKDKDIESDQSKGFCEMKVSIEQRNERLEALETESGVLYSYFWKGQELASLVVLNKCPSYHCKLIVKKEGKSKLALNINRDDEVDFIIVGGTMYHMGDNGCKNIFEQAQLVWEDWREVFENAGAVGLDEPFENLLDYSPPDINS